MKSIHGKGEGLMTSSILSSDAIKLLSGKNTSSSMTAFNSNFSE
jgi:hypothetical protein